MEDMKMQKEKIPYRKTKENSPTIEEVIECCLYGEPRENAREFVEWMRENKMNFRKGSSNTRNFTCIKNTWHLCHIAIYDESMDFNHIDSRNEGEPQFWRLTPHIYLLGDYKALIDNDEMNAIPWDDWKHCYKTEKFCACDNGPHDKILFGKRYESVCIHAVRSATNPDREMIESVKKLILLEKQARDERAANNFTFPFAR